MMSQMAQHNQQQGERMTKVSPENAEKIAGVERLLATGDRKMNAARACREMNLSISTYQGYVNRKRLEEEDARAWAHIGKTPPLKSATPILPKGTSQLRNRKVNYEEVLQVWESGRYETQRQLANHFGLVRSNMGRILKIAAFERGQAKETA